MKKNIIIALACVMALTSCGTYTGAGAGAGAYYGSWIGSLVGGISGGHRGSHVGELVGLATGAVVGAAIGSAKDREVQEDYDQYRQEKARLKANREARQSGISQDEGQYDSGFNADNSGDDRLFDFGTENSAGVSSGNAVEIRNARFVDSNGDNVITRDEMCKVVFEVYNNSNTTLNNLQPTVIETTGNKHIYLSANTPVGNLAPGKGVRYTVNVKADNRLKDGMITLCASVMQGGNTVAQVSQFNVRTGK